MIKFKFTYRRIVQLLSLVLFITLVSDHVIDADNVFATGNVTGVNSVPLELIEEIPSEEEALTSEIIPDDRQMRGLTNRIVEFNSDYLNDTVPSPPPDAR